MRIVILFCMLFNLLATLTRAQKKEIDSLQNLIQKGGATEDVLINKAELYFLYYRNGETAAMEKIYRSALLEARQSGSRKAEATLYHKHGSVYFYEYQLDSAIYYFRKALKIRKEIGDQIGSLKTISNLASVYFTKSDYQTSLELFKEGLSLESQLKLEEGTYIDLKNMAIALRYLKLNTKALNIYRSSLTSNSLSVSNQYSIYSGMASVFKEMGQMDSALVYVNKSHEIAQMTGDSVDLAYSYSNLGMIYNAIGKQQEAISYYKKSLQISKAVKDKRLEMACWANVGAAFLDLNQTDSADVYISQMLKLQNEINLNIDMEDYSKLLADYYYRKKNYSKSYEYFKIYSNYRDSIYNIESAAKLIELQEKYEAEKKERENKVLQLENKSYKSSRNYLAGILIISVMALIVIAFSYRKIIASRKLLQQQKEILSNQKEEILDSIHYARRIQYALLASNTLLEKHLRDHFVLFKPKAVVSGDFYWGMPTEKGFLYVTGDCTGHGVPGAFMSLLLITKLHQGIYEHGISRPDLLLNHVREDIVNALNPEGSEVESKDGMDAVVCHLDLSNLNLEYAAANNSFYIARRGQLLSCKADKMPVGKGYGDQDPFSFNQITLEKGDMIYTFTDGFADQFGGPAGKKFKYKQFEQLLLQIHLESPEIQKEKLESAFNNWKGNLEQIDDVCIIGVRVT